MGSAYTPGLLVSARSRISKIRELPLPGSVLVKTGERVTAATTVLSAQLPGELEIVRLSDRLGFEPEDVVEQVRVKVGQQVNKGECLCELRSLFGLLTSRAVSPISGSVEFFTEANAHLGIRGEPSKLEIQAHIAGTVTAVEAGKSVTVECDAAVIQGVFGVGGERRGQIFPLPLPLETVIGSPALRDLQEPLAGKVLVGGKTFDSSALQFCAEQQVSAVVTGSLDSEVLKVFVGREVNVAVTGDEEVPFTLIVTEGFGALPLSLRVLELARVHAGREASVNGATQVRAGAMRPEIIIPAETQESFAPSEALQELRVGTRIRCIRVPYFGEFGTVTALPLEPIKIPTKAVVRVLRAQLDRGQEVTLPRANVEIV